MKKLFVILIMLAFMAGYANAEWKTTTINVWNGDTLTLNDTLSTEWYRCGGWDEAYFCHVLSTTADSADVKLDYWLAVDTLYPAHYTKILHDSIEVETAFFDTILVYFGLFEYIKFEQVGVGVLNDSTYSYADLLLRKSVNR